jgi:uncharacterized membrane protein
VNSHVRRRLDVALLALLAGTVPLVVWPVAAPLRTLFGLATVLFVPGGAALARVRVNGWAEWFGLTIAVSLAIQTAGALVLLWTRWWHPAVLAGVLGTASVALLLSDLWQKNKEHKNKEVRGGAR